MELVIKIENGFPVNHPMLLDNLVQCRPDIDANNLPDEYKRFKRVPKPELGPYQLFIKEEPEYKLTNDVVQDVWLFRDMTPWEKQEKIDSMLEYKPYDSWVFNEEHCIWEAPISYPEDENHYIWDEPSISWVLLTE